MPGPTAGADRDGGATAQPIRDIPAAQHGDRQALNQLQGSAPMAAAGRPSAAGGASRGNPSPGMSDVFAPTERPLEAITEGVAVSPSDSADQLLAQLQAMYQLRPSPPLAGLIRRQREKAMRARGQR